MLEFLGFVFLGILVIFAWANFRAAPDDRPPAERLRSTLRLRNELANIVGVLAALILAFAVATGSAIATYVGGALVALAFLIAWSADRRERTADELEQRQGG